jgi:hypothetical protein
VLHRPRTPHVAEIHLAPRAVAGAAPRFFFDEGRGPGATAVGKRDLEQLLGCCWGFCRLLATVYWLLSIGYWLLSVVYCLFAVLSPALPAPVLAVARAAVLALVLLAPVLAVARAAAPDLVLLATVLVV